MESNSRNMRRFKQQPTNNERKEALRAEKHLPGKAHVAPTLELQIKHMTGKRVAEG